MDPNANLEEQRRLVNAINDARDNETDVDQDDIWRLAELCEALDGWISNGGFLPHAWSVR
jgi:hypothetical protein